MARYRSFVSYEDALADTLQEFYQSDTSKLGECEFWLINEMHSQLIVHHPYRSLQSIQGEIGMTSDESTLAWSVINDHYMTDLPLLYAPHIIAVTAILLVLVLAPSQQSNLGGTGVGSAAELALRSAAEQRGLPPQERKPINGVRSKLQKFSTWLADSNIDLEDMIEATQEMISFYEAQEQYNEKAAKEQIGRFVKARNLDK
jgi:cyclin C